MINFFTGSTCKVSQNISSIWRKKSLVEACVVCTNLFQWWLNGVLWWDCSSETGVKVRSCCHIYYFHLDNQLLATKKVLFDQGWQFTSLNSRRHVSVNRYNKRLYSASLDLNDASVWSHRWTDYWQPSENNRFQWLSTNNRTDCDCDIENHHSLTMVVICRPLLLPKADVKQSNQRLFAWKCLNQSQKCLISPKKII